MGEDPEGRGEIEGKQEKEERSFFFQPKELLLISLESLTIKKALNFLVALFSLILDILFFHNKGKT